MSTSVFGHQPEVTDDGSSAAVNEAGKGIYLTLWQGNLPMLSGGLEPSSTVPLWSP
jgi:hypothetical protein